MSPVADLRTALQPKGQASVSPKSRGPVAIVDIGSNSVRLVVYESQNRVAATLQNEKSICAIGRDMVTTGRLHAEGCTAALEALSRFRMIADGLNVEHRDAVATAAARDASNGAEFIRRAETAWGRPIRILAGEDEARIAAEGVVAGIPDADGLAADLGGGSLDMVSVKGGQTGAAYTLPFGPLRLMDQSKGDPDKARDLVDKGLKNIPGLSAQALYAVGGAWRSFARVDMEDQNYPLHVLQHYTIPRGRALRLCRLLAGLSKDSVRKIKVVSKRRAESLPYGAVVLERLLEMGGIKEVVISAYGLREGLLYARLPAEERAKDPLVEFARAANSRNARVPSHAGEMLEWTLPLFEDDSPEMARVREASAFFSDLAWRRHPDDRAAGAFGQVLTAPFAGASHRDRALIAASVFHRYSGDEDFPQHMALAGLLEKDEEKRALLLGLAWRFAFSLSASAAGELANYRLRMTPSKVILDVPSRREAIAGEPVQRRLGELANALGRK
ncbi:MAG TPA: Ppx/GppA family phosphatase, partial [Rhizomicrobium sp.]|nr:Ppx/GppA family phosphatase [Rhizomicrobium sp.]